VKATLIALMQDHPGVLDRVASLFRCRNFNIESLTVGHSETPGISRMTLVVDCDSEAHREQVVKQFHKLIEVTKVIDAFGDHPAGRCIQGPGDRCGAGIDDCRGHGRRGQGGLVHQPASSLWDQGARPHRAGGHAARGQRQIGHEKESTTWQRSTLVESSKRS
jgi:acetolactate synthase regulatory subunit